MGHIPQATKTLGFVLRKSAHEAYAGLAAVAAGSLAATFLALPVVTAPAALVGCVAMAADLAAGKPAGPGALLRGAWRYGARATALGVLAGALGYLPLSGWLFWHQSGALSGLVFFCFQLYLYVLFLLAATYALPLLVLEDLGPWQAFARSARLFLRHPAYTLGVWLQLGALGLVAAVATVAVPTLLPVLGALLLVNATANLRAV